MCKNSSEVCGIGWGVILGTGGFAYSPCVKIRDVQSALWRWCWAVQCVVRIPV